MFRPLIPPQDHMSCRYRCCLSLSSRCRTSLCLFKMQVLRTVTFAMSASSSHLPSIIIHGNASGHSAHLHPVSLVSDMVLHSVMRAKRDMPGSKESPPKHLIPPPLPASTMLVFVPGSSLMIRAVLDMNSLAFTMTGVGVEELMSRPPPWMAELLSNCTYSSMTASQSVHLNCITSEVSKLTLCSRVVGSTPKGQPYRLHTCMHQQILTILEGMFSLHAQAGSDSRWDSSPGIAVMLRTVQFASRITLMH